MSDVYDAAKRSAVMKRVRSSGNKSTELKMIEVFDQMGLKGWKRHYSVKGHPDFVFLKERVAVFVDGCFWHGHDCRNTRPQQNAEYWQKKRETNIRHDKEVTSLFKDRGWKVLRIWECELKKSNRDNLMRRISDYLTDGA